MVTYSNMSSLFNVSGISWATHEQEPAPPKKALEDMTDEEVGAAVTEALLFPFFCKVCKKRAKEVNTSGVCPSCASAWSWSTAAYTYSNTSAWTVYNNANTTWTSSASATTSGFYSTTTTVRITPRIIKQP